MAPMNKELRTLLRPPPMKLLPTPLPGLAGPRCEAHEGGDPSTIERTEFREFGDQGSGNGFSDARHGRQQFLLFHLDG